MQCTCIQQEFGKRWHAIMQVIGAIQKQTARLVAYTSMLSCKSDFLVVIVGVLEQRIKASRKA